MGKAPEGSSPQNQKAATDTGSEKSEEQEDAGATNRWRRCEPIPAHALGGLPERTHRHQARAYPADPNTRDQYQINMNTIDQLREKMASTVAALEKKEISAEEAMAICRAGAVVIGSLRVELQYRQSRAEKPEITFMEKAKP